MRFPSLTAHACARWMMEASERSVALVEPHFQFKSDQSSLQHRIHNSEFITKFHIVPIANGKQHQSDWWIINAWTSGSFSSWVLNKRRSIAIAASAAFSCIAEMTTVWSLNWDCTCLFSKMVETINNSDALSTSHCVTARGQPELPLK